MRTRPKHWLDRTLAPNANGKHDAKGSFRAHPVLVKDKNSEEMPGDVAMPDTRPVTGFYSFVNIAGLRGCSGSSVQDGMVVVISCTAVPKDVWSEYGRSY
jgi:hypothetical protein